MLCLLGSTCDETPHQGLFIVEPSSRCQMVISTDVHEPSSSAAGTVAPPPCLCLPLWCISANPLPSGRGYGRSSTTLRFSLARLRAYWTLLLVCDLWELSLCSWGEIHWVLHNLRLEFAESLALEELCVVVCCQFACRAVSDGQPPLLVNLVCVT